MEYTYNRTLELIQEIGTSELYNTFKNIISDKIEKTDLMKNILNIISDQTPYSNLSDDTRHKLVLALKTHFDCVWVLINVNNTNVDRLIKGMYEDVYYINAYNGIRVATQSEVENGVVSLIEKRDWKLGEQGEEIYKQFNIMMWSITGRLRYYTAAGLKYTWDKETGLVETYLQLLSRSTPVMNSLYDLLKDNNKYDSIVSAINKSIRRGKFKYPNFAVDEVKTNLSAKQLIFNANKVLWNYADDFSESKRLLMRIKKDNRFKPTPLDISKLREDYEKATSVSYQSKNKKTNKDKLTDKQLDVKTKCELIEQAVKDGKLSSSDWGNKIATTLKKHKYRFCSDKQYRIINDTVSKLEEKPKENTRVMDDSEMTDVLDDVYNVLDALGKGTLKTD